MRRRSEAPSATPAPDESSLHEAALRHLARYAATEAGLVRVLDRRVLRWAREAQAEPESVTPAREIARAVAARLAKAGVVDDAVFAQGRSRALARAGRSRAAIAAHLAGRGVPRAVADAALPDDPEHDLAAAVAAARRRRIGPFRAEANPMDADARRRELGILARAGFAQAIAERAVALSRDAADTLLRRLKQR